MDTMNVPGFTAEKSLYHTSKQYHTNQVSTGAPHLVEPQTQCPPPGLCQKASRGCRTGDEGWCDILSDCLDCRIG